MERQGDKASPRASSRPRFIAEAQPQHHPGTGQTERESHPHADQSPAQYKTAKISYGQRYNKIRNKCNNHHRLYIRYAPQRIGKVDLQSVAKLINQEREEQRGYQRRSLSLSVNQPPTCPRITKTMLISTTSIAIIRWKPANVERRTFSISSCPLKLLTRTATAAPIP